MLTRLAFIAVALCVAAVAWAVHDLTTTWNDSLRLPDEDQ